MKQLIILERSLTPNAQNTDREKVQISESKRLEWTRLWDYFRESILAGKNSWGKNEILRHMEEMERKMIRNLEKESD